MVKETMIYKIKLITVEYATIEQDNYASAEEKLKDMVNRINKHNHHGEHTIGILIPIKKIYGSKGK